MANMSKSEREAFLAEPHVGVISIECPDRGPLTVPIWYDYTPGGTLSVLTGVGSRKEKLIAAAGRFSLCVQSTELPYRYVSVEGPVVEQRPADTERDRRPMARRYLGKKMGDAYTNEGVGDDVVFAIQPTRWSSVDYGKTDA